MHFSTQGGFKGCLVFRAIPWDLPKSQCDEESLLDPRTSLEKPLSNHRPQETLVLQQKPLNRPAIQTKMSFLIFFKNNLPTTSRAVLMPLECQ